MTAADRCPPFRPSWWLRNAHMQTLWPVLCRRHPRPAVRREQLELDDGDFLHLDWLDVDGVDPSAPIVLVLHGLEGSIESKYAAGLLATARERGWLALLLNFRGCSGEPNRLPRAYHSGETGDVATVVDHLRKRFANRPLVAVGYSLGGNVLLKWLGECGVDCALSAAVAVSVPFELGPSARRIGEGLSRVYQWHLISRLRESIRRKRECVALDVPSEAELRRLRSFHEFDDAVTAPLHGFRDVEHYYTDSSSRAFLGRIRVPTLVIQSRDDPLVRESGIPEPSELPAHLELECYSKGGHVGFVSGAVPWRPQYWLEQRIPEFIADHMTEALATPSRDEMDLATKGEFGRIGDSPSGRRPR